MTKEAVISSSIEGTQTNINEALLPVNEIAPEKRNDWREVNNYTRALNYAIKELEYLPLSSRLLKNAHHLLLDNVRGENKLPGQFRSSQNWIGGSGPADAAFVPPAHIYVNDLMGDLENFLHNEQVNVPALIRIGIAHYQFETIHPFLDGNGRIDRLMITLFLVEQDILRQPLLYLSAYFEKNKTHYYDNLTRVRQKNDMLHWLKYFLIGIEQTAQKAVETLSRVLQMKQKLEADIYQNWGRRINSAITFLNYLFIRPVATVKDVERICSLSKKAAGDLVGSFEKADIFFEETGQSRNRIFAFKSYLDLFS